MKHCGACKFYDERDYNRREGVCAYPLPAAVFASDGPSPTTTAVNGGACRVFVRQPEDGLMRRLREVEQRLDLLTGDGK
jgi:hypothetical protein